VIGRGHAGDFMAGLVICFAGLGTAALIGEWVRMKGKCLQEI
jgi:hypothetical protein